MSIQTSNKTRERERERELFRNACDYANFVMVIGNGVAQLVLPQLRLTGMSVFLFVCLFMPQKTVAGV